MEEEDGKAKKDGPENGNVQHLGPGGDTRGETGKEKDNITRISDRRTKADESEGPEDTEASCKVVADGDNHDAGHDGRKRDGLHERT